MSKTFQIRRLYDKHKLTHILRNTEVILANQMGVVKHTALCMGGGGVVGLDTLSGDANRRLNQVRDTAQRCAQ